MEQLPQSIYDFQKGDIITRVEPSKPIEIFAGETIQDRQYIGDPLVFLGVANGCVYLEKHIPNKNEIESEISGFAGLMKMLMGPSGPINLPLDAYDEGWSYYIDPYKIGEDSLKLKAKKLTNNLSKYEKSELEKRLKSALEKEDYHSAKIIQKRLNNLK